MKVELQSVKEDNECILKAQGELNNVLLNKIHNHEEENNKGHELEIARTAAYKHKIRKIKFSNNETDSSSEK